MHKEDIPFFILIIAFIFVLINIFVMKSKIGKIEQKLTRIELQYSIKPE